MVRSRWSQRSPAGLGSISSSINTAACRHRGGTQLCFKVSREAAAPPLPCRLQDVLWRAGSRTATQSITLHAFHPAAKHGKHAACRVVCSRPAIFGTPLPVIPQPHGRRSQMALSNPCDDPWPYRSNRRTTLYASADGVGGQGRDYRRNRRQKTPGVLHGSLPTRQKSGVARRTLQAETRVAPKCGESVDRVDRHPLDPRRCDMRADLQLAKRKRHGVQLRVSSQKRVLELASTSKSGAAVLSDRAREEKEAKQRTKIAAVHIWGPVLRCAWLSYPGIIWRSVKQGGRFS